MDRPPPVVNVTVCWHWDPFSSYPGGIGRFIEDLIKYAPTHFHFTILAMTAQDIPLFESVEYSLGGKSCSVVPVVTQLDRQRRQKLPLKLRYVLGIRRYVRSRGITDQVIHYHGIEPWFGLKPDSSGIMFLHKNPSYRWVFSSESQWRFLPQHLYRILEKRVIVGTRKLFFVNRDTFTKYLKKYPHRAGDLELISTWVDPENFYFINDPRERAETRRKIRQREGWKEEENIINYFGRFDEIKDPLLAIRSLPHVLQAYPQTRLVMVGSGQMEKAMKKESLTLRLEGHVEIRGYQDKNFIRELLWASDLSVLPSRSEGMSMAVNESLACACPVVGFDVGEAARLIEAGKSGEIVAKRTPESFAEGISRVLSRQPYYQTHPETVARNTCALTPKAVLEPVYRSTENLHHELCGRSKT